MFERAFLGFGSGFSVRVVGFRHCQGQQDGMIVVASSAPHFMLIGVCFWFGLLVCGPV
jgi:Na+-transporting NADH:ubiquinone oxidoreductase subunit NqrD